MCDKGVKFKYSVGKLSPLLNPGNLTMLHDKCQAIVPIWLDGVQFRYQNISNPNFTPFFEVILSHLRPSGARFGMSRSMYVDEHLSKSPFILMDINPNTLSANICLQYYPTPSLRFQWRGQAFPSLSRLSMENYSTTSMTNAIGAVAADSTKHCENTFSMDWFRPSTTVSFNTDVFARQSTISCLQHLTDQITIGKELIFEWKDEEVVAKAAVAIRYNYKGLALAASYSMDNSDLDITLWRQMCPYFQLGTSIMFNGITKRAVSTIYYQKDFQNSIVRGMIDSKSSVGFTYDRFISNIGTFGLSLLWCINANRFLCGFKLDLNSIAPLMTWFCSSINK